MQAEEHDLIKYTVLAYIYLILSEFRAPKMAPSLPSSLAMKYARGVVVCCEGAVNHLACWLSGLFTYLLACLLACLLVCLVGWLIGLLVACLVGWLVGWLVSWLVGCLLTCSLARWLACLLFRYSLLAYFDLLCLVDLRGRAVEHQKLNQTTPTTP